MKNNYPKQAAGILIGLFLIISIVALARISGGNNLTPSSSTKKPTSTTPITGNNPLNTASLTASTVAQHNGASDCWMIIDKQVYNLTDYVSQHPGGYSIVRGCGRDATRAFNSVYSHNDGSTDGNNNTASQALEKYLVGKLQ